ncbi:mechanosensitive ion channel family protein [Crenalkalicoccus roseus]|uniref:mechanosensitive ion channel family protein n=1 Tax=Crenalkalicoccus roseus TaxID=1485588 RepID=UPI001081B56F|nr:mechanosensitive ion channel domain-containing protein [Crenalkalicoccus roseus]
MRLPRLLLAILLLLAAAPAQPQEATPAPRPALTAAEIERLGALLRDEARRAEFLRTLEALAAAARARPEAAEGATPAAPAAPSPQAAAPPADTAGEAAPAPQPEAPPAAAPEPLIVPNTVGAHLLLGLQERLGHASEAVLGTIRSMADLPSVWHSVIAMLRDPVVRSRVAEAAWKLLPLLLAALALEWLVWRGLAGARRRLGALAPGDGQVWGWVQRVPLVLARLVVDLLPILGFALVAYGLLGFVRMLPNTQLAGLLVAHVYIAARCIFVLGRVLLSPSSRHLRLVPLSDQAAFYCTVWLRRMLLVGLGGHVLAEVGVSLGLSWAAYDAIVNVTLLLISLMLVWIILQQRATVAAALRAPPLEPGERPDRGRAALRALRDGLAGIWHVVVILWLLALWVVSALAIEDGFERLLTASLLTLLIGGLAKGLDELLRRVLDRALQPAPGAEAAGWGGLSARAAAYAPALRVIVSLAIVFGGVVMVLEVWGVDATGWFAPGTLGSRLLGTLFSIGATLVLGVLAWELANAAIKRRLMRAAGETQAARSARLRTLLPMLRTALGVVILTFVVLSSLAQLGVNVAPLLAGAGVVGLAVGFGSQTLVRDVITGIFLLLEDAVAVGEVVTVAGQSGVVEQLSIRSIRLRSMDGSVHFVPFSAVTTVTNMTRDFSFAVLDVTVSYREDTDRVVEALREVSAEMRAEAKWQAMIRDDLEVMGVERFADSGVVIRTRIKTEPIARWNVLREFQRRVKRRFDELGIEIPYPHQKLVLDPGLPRFPPQPAAEGAARPGAA